VQSEQVLSELADDLWQAEHTGVPAEPLTKRHPGLVIDDAYAIQSLNIDRHIAQGARVCGRKVGLTSLPMQELLGVSEPDYGVLLDHMFVEDGDEVALDRLLQPRVEAELAFVMEEDLAGPGVTAARALTAIAGALPAVEIVDSRVADWQIKLVDTVADNASSGLLVVGGNLRKVTDIDLRLVGVMVTRHGELVDTGAGAAVLGNPARCVAWLANKLATFGASLHAGDIVLPGAVHRMIGVQPGDVFRAEFAYLGTVTARFSGGGSLS
jgi:2-keto-4-pentenoate hydratase